MCHVVCDNYRCDLKGAFGSNSRSRRRLALHLHRSMTLMSLTRPTVVCLAVCFPILVKYLHTVLGMVLEVAQIVALAKRLLQSYTVSPLPDIPI